jgi:hypothetical protein
MNNPFTGTNIEDIKSIVNKMDYTPQNLDNQQPHRHKVHFNEQDINDLVTHIKPPQDIIMNTHNNNHPDNHHRDNHHRDNHHRDNHHRDNHHRDNHHRDNNIHINDDIKKYYQDAKYRKDIDNFIIKYNKSKIKKKINIDSKNITVYLKEIVLLASIFYILSQGPIKLYLGKVIPEINVNSDGIVSQLGIVIYGIVLSVLFILLKHFI